MLPDTRLKVPRLLAISSPQVRTGPAWRQWCVDLGAAGVDGLQVRPREASDFELLALAVEARAATAGVLTLIVNARPDVAVASGADGVQLPAAGLPLPAVRRALPDSFLVGRSTHSAEEVGLARDQGADFALFGPIFETPSKAGRIPARGLGALQQAAACGLPVVALGGIDAGNVASVLDSGAWGVAAIRWFADPIAGREDFAALHRRWRSA